MWNAAHFLGILAFSSDGGKEWGLCRKNGDAGNNSLKSLMLEGSTGERCEYIQDIVFVCVGPFGVCISKKL